MEVIAFLLIVAGVGLLAVWLFVVRQGDAQFDFLVDQRTPFALQEVTPSKAVFVATIPFVNKGTQDGTIMDCYPRHLMPCEYYDECYIESRLTIESAQRHDGYWEANIVFKKHSDAIILTIGFTAKAGDIRQALQTLPDMPVDIVYQIVARSDWYITKQRLVVPAAELQAALQQTSTRQ